MRDQGSKNKPNRYNKRTDYGSKYGRDRKPYRGGGEDRDFEMAADGEYNSAVEESESGIVAGRNAVRELLRSGRSIDKLFVKSGSREGSVTVLVAEALKRHIPVIDATQEKLDSLCGGINHQGIVAMAAQKDYTDIDTVLRIAEERGEKPLLVIADGGTELKLIPLTVIRKK